MTDYTDLSDFEDEEKIAQDECDRAYRRAVLRAPDCRDPAHPGCPDCE